jgi:hypothetical protein
MHLCRWYVRSSIEGLSVVAIGSGEKHVEKLLSQSAWPDIRADTSISGRDRAVLFLLAAFHQASLVESDVNACVQTWFRGAHDVSFQRGLNLSLHEG